MNIFRVTFLLFLSAISVTFFLYAIKSDSLTPLELALFIPFNIFVIPYLAANAIKQYLSFSIKFHDEKTITAQKVVPLSK